MWFIIGYILGICVYRYVIKDEIEDYGYFRLNGKYYYPEDEIRK